MKPHFPARISMKRHGATRILSRPVAPPSLPVDAREKAGDLFAGAIRIFPMREVADAGKHREIEAGKGFAELIGPRIWKQRIVLGPAHAGRHVDRWQLWRFALHHLHPSRMGRAVMRKAAG